MCICKNLIDCNGQIESPDIDLTSPDYPSVYNDNQDCSQTIRFSEGQTIILEFLEFDLLSSQWNW